MRLVLWRRSNLCSSRVFRSVRAVTVEVCGCSTHTGWEKTPHTSSSKWSSSTPSTKPSDATPTRNGSPRLCTSTGRCVGSRPLARRAVVWARATSSTSPSAALDMLPGRDATPCSCTVTAKQCVLQLAQIKSLCMVTCCLYCELVDLQGVCINSAAYVLWYIRCSFTLFSLGCEVEVFRLNVHSDALWDSLGVRWCLLHSFLGYKVNRELLAVVPVFASKNVICTKQVFGD